MLLRINNSVKHVKLFESFEEPVNSEDFTDNLINLVELGLIPLAFLLVSTRAYSVKQLIELSGRVPNKLYKEGIIVKYDGLPDHVQGAGYFFIGIGPALEKFRDDLCKEIDVDKNPILPVPLGSKAYDSWLEVMEFILTLHAIDESNNTNDDETPK